MGKMWSAARSGESKITPGQAANDDGQSDRQKSGCLLILDRWTDGPGTDGRVPRTR